MCCEFTRCRAFPREFSLSHRNSLIAKPLRPSRVTAKPSVQRKMVNDQLPARRRARVEWPTLALLAAHLRGWAAVTAFARRPRALAGGADAGGVAGAAFVAAARGDPRPSDAGPAAERGAGVSGAGAADALPAVPRPAPGASLRPAADRPARRPGVRTTSTRRSGRGSAAGARGARREQHAARADGDRAVPRHVAASGATICAPRSAPATARWRRPGLLHAARRGAGGAVARPRSGTMPLGAYLAGCWLALSILRIRTFLEHQAHEQAARAA